MKNIYEEVKEELIMKEVEKTRLHTVEELDQAIEGVIKELTNRPLAEENEEDRSWHENLTDRLLHLIYLKRKSVKIKSFKELNMEEITKAIIGY